MKGIVLHIKCMEFKVYVLVLLTELSSFRNKCHPQIVKTNGYSEEAVLRIGIGKLAL